MAEEKGQFREDPLNVEFNSYLQALGMKTTEIAERLNVKPNRISMIKSGDRKPDDQMMEGIRKLSENGRVKIRLSMAQISDSLEDLPEGEAFKLVLHFADAVKTYKTSGKKLLGLSRGSNNRVPKLDV